MRFSTLTTIFAALGMACATPQDAVRPDANFFANGDGSGDIELMSHTTDSTAGRVQYSGRINEKRWKDFGPFIVDEHGLSAFTDGQGDVDLYIAKGRTPDSMNFDCASSGVSAVESCKLTGEGEYYIALYGYEEQNIYDLTVEYSDTSPGSIMGRNLNLAFEANFTVDEGAAAMLNDGNMATPWLTEGPVAADEAVGLKLEFREPTIVESLILDWVPSLEPTYVRAVIENRGTIKDLGLFLIDGRRTTISFEPTDTSTIEFTFENSDDDQVFGVRETWVW